MVKKTSNHLIKPIVNHPDIIMILGLPQCSDFVSIYYIFQVTVAVNPFNPFDLWI